MKNNYTILWRLFVLLFFSIYLLSCRITPDNKESSVLQSELNHSYKHKISQNISRLIFITDEGCPNCVISFSQFILNNVENYKQNSLVFINSSGTNVDIDTFKALKNKNIIISEDYPMESKLLPRLGIVYLKKGTQEIDTIISIEASQIKKQFKFILQKR